MNIYRKSIPSRGNSRCEALRRQRWGMGLRKNQEARW